MKPTPAAIVAAALAARLLTGCTADPSAKETIPSVGNANPMGPDDPAKKPKFRSTLPEVIEDTSKVRTATMPNVLRLQQSAAEKALRNAGFHVEVRLWARGLPPWRVTRQFPKAGTELKPGDTVRIDVA